MKPSFNIIPAIDLLDQRVVRLTQGNYDDVTNYSSDPVQLAIDFQEAGATYLHVVDLNGAKEGTTVNFSIIEAIRKHTNLNMEIGGGLRTLDAIKAYFDIGINQLILGSVMINDFNFSEQVIRQFPNKIIAGLDVKESMIAIHGWTEKSSYTMSDFLLKIKHLPLHSIIYTDISKDGMMSGPDFEGLSIFSKISHVPIIASGGIRGKEDIEKLKSIDNISGAIIGKALLSQAVSLSELFR